MSKLDPPVLSLPETLCKIPKSAKSWSTDPDVVVLRSYTVAQEEDAANVAKNGTELEHQLLQRCCISVDGKPNDQAFNFLDKCSPKVRKLLRLALNKQAMPDEAEEAAFLKGLEVRVP